MSAAKFLRFLLAVAVSAGFLWLLLRGVDGGELVAIVSGASWSWLLAALLALSLGYALRIARWQSLLSKENPRILWRQCAGPLLAGFAMNNVLPFRAGDAMRCVGFGSQLGVSGGGAMATLFVERLLDALMLLAALGLALLFFGIDGQRFFAVGGAALAALAVLLVLLLMFPTTLVFLLGRLSLFFGWLVPKWAGRLREELEKARIVLEANARGNTLTPLLGWSLLVWAAEGMVFYSVARALLALESPLAAWLALPVATLATLLPGTPGYIGTFDFFAAEAMTAAGNAAVAATAYALLVHLWLWLPVTLAGGLWLWGRRS